MSQQTKTAFAVVVIIAAAGAFWLLLLSPKRDKAGELSTQVTAAKVSLNTEKAAAENGLAAKKKFRHDYQQLILLGKAVPAEAETASLLVQLNALGRRTQTPFRTIAGGEGEAGSEATTETGGPAELAVSQEPPLESSPGPAGFREMSVALAYEGGYFALLELMKHIDGMVTTKEGRVVANGRLVTIDSFSLAPESFRHVVATMNVTSYTTPPNQGLTSVPSPAGPSAEGASQ
jgi:hypothetical protein